MKRLAATLLPLLIMSGAGAQQPIEYRLEEVRRSVTVTHDGTSQRASKGSQAASGDQVETGWFSYALLGSDRHRARFEIFGSTTVKLASDTPGVILTLERGRIRAAFDKITGSEPRSVQTPGALLAVRGTQFDVVVDREGNTTLDVFEGLVEVKTSLHREPLFVRPGESSSFGPRRPPVVGPMPQHRRENGPDRAADRNRNRDEQGNERRGEPGQRPEGNRGDRPPQQGPQQPPQQSPPQSPPPRRPPL